MTWPDDYVRRIVDGELDELLGALPALAIDGPKAVGKTATAARRAATIYPLDAPEAGSIIAGDPGRVATGDPPILIDEWQRVPATWDVVRRSVDADPSPGRFLLAGSATPLDARTHSGAGRIVSVRMRPMTLAERGVGEPTVSIAQLLTGERLAVGGRTAIGLDEYANEICASGFPGFRRLEQRSLRAQLDGYLARIVERDFPEIGRIVRNPATLRRWLTAYAAATATTASYETIRDAATAGEREKPARTTTQPYRDVLERLWIIDPLPAWLPSRNSIARLTAGPKHHLADPALAARLLGAGVDALVSGRPMGPSIARDTTLLAQLFESLVALDVRVYAQAAEAGVRHLRTHSGEHEVDLIVERADHRVLAIEVKLGRVPTERDARHLRWLGERLGEELLDAVIVTTGTEAYRRPDGIAVIPAALLGP